MVTTIRVHMNPKESLGSLSHNISKSFRAREKHVDGQSDRFEVWKNSGVYEVYNEVFGDSIRAYNDRQKRKDRKILDADGDPVGGYIQSIQTGRRGKRKRAVYKTMPDGSKEEVGKSSESQGQRILYELVCSAGNCEKQRDGSGRIMYTDDGHEIHPYRLPYEVHRAACRELADRFEEFYPHFKLAAACWHGDEFYLNEKDVKEYGTEHVHINFIPWADGYKRGLPIQASMSKALEQMGFVNGMDENGVWHNAYYYWTQDVQKKFEGILREKFAEHQRERAKELEQCSLLAAMFRPEPLYFEHPAKGKNLPNLAPAEYRELKDVERQVNKARKELDDVQEKIDGKKEALEHAELMIAEAEEKEKNMNEYAASKKKDADRYYADRKEEADALLLEAEEKRRERMREIDLRFGHIFDTVKKISDNLEFYKKRCGEVVKGNISLNIPNPVVERWMKKRKMEKAGMRISIYDAYMEELSPVLKRKAKAQYDDADALSIEVRRQMEIAKESMKDDDKEDDTGYGFVV